MLKKSYSDKMKRQRSRNWKLKKLNVEKEHKPIEDNIDYMEFLEDLEEDEEFRKNVNIYFGKSNIKF